MLLLSNVGVHVFWLVAEELRRTVQEKDNLIAQLQQRIVELDLRCQFFETASHDGLLLWKVADVDQRISDAKERCIVSLYSPPFYAGRYGYKLCVRVYFNGDGDGYGTHVSLFFVIMKASEQNCIFDPALVSAHCVIFVNISNYVNREFRHSVWIDNEHLRIIYEKTNNIFKCLRMVGLNPSYKLSFSDVMGADNDGDGGDIFWHLNFLNQWPESCFCSEENFFLQLSTTYGWCSCLMPLITLVGFGQTSPGLLHYEFIPFSIYQPVRLCLIVIQLLSVLYSVDCIQLMLLLFQGEYDDLLEWPFTARVTLTLIDQSPARRHHSETFRPDPQSSSFHKPETPTNIASGSPRFISHTKLLEIGQDGQTFVKNDTVYFRVVINMSDITQL